METVESLLEEGADIDATDEEGCTALERASFAGKADVVKLLLKKGARIEGKHGFSTPLILAAAHWGKWKWRERFWMPGRTSTQKARKAGRP